MTWQYVFPRLTPVAIFPVLDTGYMYSRDCTLAINSCDLPQNRKSLRVVTPINNKIIVLRNLICNLKTLSMDDPVNGKPAHK